MDKVKSGSRKPYLTTKTLFSTIEKCNLENNDIARELLLCYA
jgi:hypothetical protein